MMTGVRCRGARRLVAWLACGAASVGMPASAQTITWHDSLAAAVASAKDSREPILVEVTCGGCKDCRAVCNRARDELRRSLADARVVEWSMFFECARAKTRKGAVEQRFHIKLVPTVLLLEPDGRSELKRLGGPVTAGALVEAMSVGAALGRALQDLKTRPNDPGALAAVGRVYSRLEKHDRAVGYLRQALATGNEFAGREDAELDAAICQRIEAAKGTSGPGGSPRWLQDLEAFVRAHPGSPRHGEALFYLSTGYLEVGEPEAAERCLEQVIALESAESRWHRLAQETLTKAQLPRIRGELRRRPNDAVANYRMGHALLMVGEFDHALKCLTKALELDPEDARGCKADATLDLAILHCWLDARVGGVRLTHFIREYPTSERIPEALCHLATWEYSMGTVDKALDTARRLIRLKPESPWAQKARELVERIEAEAASTSE